jgi:hypothetical protein
VTSADYIARAMDEGRVVIEADLQQKNSRPHIAQHTAPPTLLTLLGALWGRWGFLGKARGEIMRQLASFW